MGQLVADEQA